MPELNDQSQSFTATETELVAPDPQTDWIDQRELAAILTVSEKTACCWAKEGRFVVFEHGFEQCGRRKYSRTLVRRDIQRRWQQAIRRQDGTTGS